MTEEKEINELPVPPLRNALEAVQIEHDGKPMILLRDQEGLTQSTIALSMAGFLITGMFDGTTKISEIQKVLTQRSGVVFKREEIEKLIDQLKKAEFLETPEVATKRKKTWDDFSKSDTRPAHHMNNGYPSDKLELAKMLGGYFKDPKGPGKAFEASPDGNKPPLGLISPHIDMMRGGPAYAWAYQTLSQTQPPDIIVALGVAHMAPNSPWVLTPKEYETPYGSMEVNEELYDKVDSHLWYDGKEDEWVHRTEHSLEFQALWLKYLWRENTPQWIPILCSSFERFCPDTAPSTVTTIDEALQKIGEVLRDYQKQGKTVMVLGGVDLTHVGPRFGDNEKLGVELEKKVEKEDRASLELALAGDADAYYLSVVKDNHWRKWCGLSALYSSLRLIKTLSDGEMTKGNLLAYDQASDPMGGLVSFTSILFP